MTGGTLSPGTASTTGTLTAGSNVSFSSAAAYDFTLGSSGYDQLNETLGSISLGSSTSLNVTLGSGFTPSVSSPYVIIKSTNPISGSFASYREGSTVTVGGLNFTISYQNDEVTLTYAPVASQLVFGQPPTNTTYGYAISPAVTVDIEDQFNDIVTTSTATVALALANNPTSASLGGTTSIGAVNGVVTFNNLTLNMVGTGYTLSATSSGLNSGTSGSFNITPAALTVTANNQTTVYGAALPTLTASYSGFVNGDSPASLTTQPTLTTTATSGRHVAGSPYSITASGAVDSNYSVSYVAGTLTVTPAPLTITANNQNEVYGATMPTLTATYSGFVNGDTSANLTTQPTLTTTATAGSHVAGSPYSITASGAADSDYSISYVAGTLTVSAAPLTITADNQIKVYGAALPSLAASYSGFVNGDTSASLTTQPMLTTTATASSHVAGSPYAITASGAADSDYSISYVTGSLTITPAALTITADDQTKVYGAALPTLTASYSGFVNGDSPASLTTQPTLTTTATAGSHVAGSPYSITASDAVDSDYSIGYVTGSLTITPAALTITADDQTKVYGAALPTLTASYSGFVNGDTSASLTTQPTLTTTATASSHVAGSPYAITASGAADSDYSISYVAGSLTVTPAALTISADNQTKVYGAALPTLTAIYSGFVNGETSASLTTQPTLTTTAAASSHVAGSPYAITASGAADSDYSISYVNGSLTITPAALTITADDQTKVYGAALPTLTASYSGFVNGDTSASLTTQPTLTTTATASSHVAGSPYAITASGAADSDYSISYVTGSLTITPAALTITADNQIKVYGAALPTLTASYSGFVNGDTSASLTTQPMLLTTATASSQVSGNPYAITASGAADSDYNISYVGGNLTVTAAPLTITADNQTKVYGAALPTLTASYSGFVSGDTSASLTTQPMLTTTVTASSQVSGNPYAITASGAADSDYSISYVGGNLTVTAAPLTITANNQSKVYGAALPTLTASYSGFVNGDTSASLTTQPTLSTTATASSHVAGSPYAITASDAVDSDYSISYVAGTLNVTPAALTITADNQTKVYGAALPTLTASYSGFVNGDTSASLTTQPTLSTTATASSHVAGSPHTITASGAVDLDYGISFVAGSLTITPAALTITSDNQTKVYGAALPTLTASYSGFVNGDTSASLTMQPTLTTTATAGSHVAGSPYSITASDAMDSDYSISYVAGSLAVTAAPLTITANNQTNVYGSALPTLTASYSGFMNGDTPASLTTQPTLSTTAAASSQVSGNPYAITASGAADSDYSISYVSGNLTVTAAPLTITADNQTEVYGAALPTLTASYSGFVNGDTSASLTTQPTVTTTATASSPVGIYDIAASDAVDADYAIIYVAGTMTISPAITLSPTTLPVATVGREYSQRLTAAGGSGAGYRFAATGLPAGLSLTTVGLLSGTPTTAIGSPFTVEVRVTDGDGGTSSEMYAVTVRAEAITGTIVSSPAQLYYGEEVTLTAAFSANPAGSASMTGTVAFYDGSTYLGTAPMVATSDPSGTSRLSLSSLSVGDHIITAVYSGDANYATAAVEAPVSVQVVPAVTRVTLTSAVLSQCPFQPAPLPPNRQVPPPKPKALRPMIPLPPPPQGITLTASVVVTSPGSPPVVGNVSFYDRGTLLGTAAVSNGVAILNVGSLSPGSHSFSADFSGDGASRQVSRRWSSRRTARR